LEELPVARFLAGASACFLLITGAFLLWQGSAEHAPLLPPAPPARAASPSMIVPPGAPEATLQSREQKRFSRADKDRNGRIEREELLQPRRKAFAKLDKDANGTLSFEEWAVRTVEKFGGADRDRSGWLTPAEYATTAPKPRPRPACGC
jgi:EF hand domain-containing protein